MQFAKAAACYFFAGMLHLLDALRLMGEKDTREKLKPFSLSFYTHNKRTGKGGDIKELPAVRLLTKDTSPNKKPASRTNVDSPRQRKNPQHFKNATRNVVDNTGTVCKFRIHLMRTFNGQAIYY